MIWTLAGAKGQPGQREAWRPQHAESSVRERSQRAAEIRKPWSDMFRTLRKKGELHDDGNCFPDL